MPLSCHRIQISVWSHFCKALCKDHSCKVLLNLAHRLRKRFCSKKLLMDACTDTQLMKDIKRSEMLTLSKVCYCSRYYKKVLGAKSTLFPSMYNVRTCDTILESYCFSLVTIVTLLHNRQLLLQLYVICRTSI